MASYASFAASPVLVSTTSGPRISVQGTSRIVFALARHGVLPKGLARVSGPKRVPRNAVLGVLVAVVVLNAATLAALKNGLESFTWWVNGLVFLATLTFLAVNVASFLYFIRFARGEFNNILNLVVPLVGVALNAYLIYAAFFSALWSGDARTGKSVVSACLALLALQIAAIVCIRMRKPTLLARDAPIGAELQAPSS